MNGFQDLSKSTAFCKGSTEKAGAVAGFLYFLQGGDGGGGIISWILEVIRNFGEYLTFVREHVGEPITAKEIFLALFKEEASQEINEWFLSFSQSSTEMDSLTEAVLFTAAMAAFGVLVIGLIFYIIKLVILKLRNDMGSISSGRADAKAAGVFITRDTILPQIVIMFTPLIVLGLIWAIRVRLINTVLAIYEPDSIGGTLFELLIGMLEGQEIVWFAVFFPFLVLAAGVMLFLLVLVILWIFGATIWSMVELARHGVGENLVVFMDTTYTVVKPIIVLALMATIFLLGPGVLNARILSWMPIAIGLLLWIVMVSATPFMMWFFAFPKLERRALYAVHKVQHYFNPQTPRIPRQWFLDPEHKSPREVSPAGVRNVISKGYELGTRTASLYTDIQTGGASTLIREQLRERLRR